MELNEAQRWKIEGLVDFEAATLLNFEYVI